MNAKQAFTRILFLLILLVASLFAKHVILGGMYLTSLKAAPPLAGSIAPSLASAGSKNTLPQAGKDFKILKVNYFDNQQWAVVLVAHIPDMNSATLLLQKLNGVYAVVLGPGTTFPASTAQSMPSDVAAYLMSKGLL